MRAFLLLATIVTWLVARPERLDSVHTYVQSMIFDHSVQKKAGRLFGIESDLYYGPGEYRLAYETAQTQTRQPPLTHDLETEKLFLQYGHAVSGTFGLRLHYINILKDNIAPTANGKVHGLGFDYTLTPALRFSGTRFATDYDTFGVCQDDLKIDFRSRIDALALRLTSVTHAIRLQDHRSNSFSKNARSSYLTSGLKLNLHYGKWVGGVSGYLGKRVFAVMNDGFKIQHHAMEFDRTYGAGLGRKVGGCILRIQYTYQRATEVPMQNRNVEARATVLHLHYRF